MAYRYYTRRFLNGRGHHAGGYVLAYVENTTKRRPQQHEWTDVEFTLADCGRQISLSFDVDSKELPNSLRKIDILLDTLTRFRAALVEEGRLAAEREQRPAPTTTTVE